MEPAQRPRPVGDVDTRTSVTVWPLFTLLLNLDFVLGLFSGLVLAGICGVAGTPKAVQVAVGALSGVAVWAASWLRTSIKFTPDDLVVTMLLWPRRISWARVSSVTFVDSYDDDDRPGKLTTRRVQVRYRRDLSTPTGPVPMTLGEYRPWARQHYRSLTLPLTFRPGSDAADSVGHADDGTPPPPRTRFGRHSDRQRQVIRREFAARGYQLPD